MFNVRKGEQIKCGDRLYWWVDANGKKFVRIAEFDEEANAVAAEDLDTVDVYVDTKKGVAWCVKPEPPGLRRERLKEFKEATDELDRTVRGAFATPSWEEFHEWRQEYHDAKVKFDEAHRRLLPLVTDNGATIEFKTARPHGSHAEGGTDPVPDETPFAALDKRMGMVTREIDEPREVVLLRRLYLELTKMPEYMHPSDATHGKADILTYWGPIRVTMDAIEKEHELRKEDDRGGPASEV
jgi:hypothetical protein